MATTTRVLLLQRLSEMFGDWWSAATTSAGTTTTVVDTKLAQFSADDDFCLGWYVRKVSTDEVRRITGYTASTTTITHVAFPAAVGNAATYELHRHDPTDKHNALQQAVAHAYPDLYLPLRDETLVVDQLLANGDFESAISGGAHPSWTNVGAGITVTAETSLVMHGAQSCKIVAGAGAAGQVTQAPTINIREITGKSARFAALVYATAASVARIRLDWDGTNFANSDYHTANDQWELLTVTASVPASATQVKGICEVAAGGTGYFDTATLAIMPLYRYTIPTAMLKGPYYVTEQDDEFNPSGTYSRYLSGVKAPRKSMRLRLEGIGILTVPTTDAGTIEIGSPQTTLLLAYAARNLNRILAGKAAGQQRDRYQEDIGMWEQEVGRLLAQHNIKMSRMGAENPRGVYHVEEDSTTRYLVLDQAR